MASTSLAHVTGGRTLEVQGLRELERNLNRVGRVLRRDILQDALLLGVGPLVDEWSRNAARSSTPGGTTGRGHAADSIHGQAVRNIARQAEVHVGPEVWGWYLSFTEFGTPHIAANAAGRRAADRTLPQVTEQFSGHVRLLVEQAVRR